MLRTVAEYVESLRDGRRVFYQGSLVEDVTAEPDLRVAIDMAALDFELAHDPDHRDKVLVKDPDSGAEIPLLYQEPRSPGDVQARGEVIELATAKCAGIPPLIKEIGTDALFALLRVTDGEYYERARAFYEHCRDGDLAVAVAQTDVKGDRSLAPSAQPDPDLYLHVVSESTEGIVVRGAKMHTSASVNANEIIVLPTRAMGPDDADYAVSFAVPVATPGLTLYTSSHGAGTRGPFQFPAASRSKMLDTLTVFDDVFVPWERVFAFRQPELAGPLALTFVEYHRFTAVSYKLPLVDTFVGGAARIADMNGVGKAGHIRDKLTHLINYAETVRGLTELAAGDLGGYHAVLAVHAEGSVEAEKMQILRSYDPTRAFSLVGELAQLED